MQNQFSHLIGYPQGCAEQRESRNSACWLMRAQLRFHVDTRYRSFASSHSLAIVPTVHRTMQISLIKSGWDYKDFDLGEKKLNCSLHISDMKAPSGIFWMNMVSVHHDHISFKKTSENPFGWICLKQLVRGRKQLPKAKGYALTSYDAS